MSPRYSANKVNTLRNHAQNFNALPEITIEGWSKSPVNPINLLTAFPSISLRQGFVLRGYVFRAGGNGNGIIWVVPESSPFLEPEDCIKLDDYFLSPPKPPDALDDLMEAIEGDGTPWSYLSASLFKREAQEFGALWHGRSWCDQSILGKSPMSLPNKTDSEIF